MKKLEHGRSMVEMLGVLAIIGVLSVGAIAGYQKAMFKYKINKSINIISHVVSNIAKLESVNIKNLDIAGSEDAVKYGIIPECVVNDNGYCPLPLGEISISFATIEETSLSGQIYINFTKQPFDSCVAFLSSDIYKATPDEWWYPIPEIPNSGGFIFVSSFKRKYFYGKSESVLSDGAKSNPTNQDILEACESCKNADNCDIFWSIRDGY